MGNFHFDTMPYGIFGFVFDLFLLFFCFALGFYLPWDISQMQRLSPRKC